MSIAIISPEQWQTQRWQNGGGITHQLARSDDDKGMRWRLSIAEVAADGPFSRFENIERIILLLEGEGFCLHGVGADPQVLDKTLQPFAFAGEAEIDCKLIHGPVKDFNLMSRRADVKASLEVISLKHESLLTTLSSHTFIYVHSGELSVECSATSFLLESGQTLRFSNEKGNVGLASATACQMLLVRLD